MAVIVVVVVVEVLVALVARFGRLLKAGGAAASRFSSGVARARAPVRTSSDHLLPIVPRACFATSPKSFFESGKTRTRSTWFCTYQRGKLEMDVSE